jgi:hypothetical protein
MRTATALLATSLALAACSSGDDASERGSSVDQAGDADADNQSEACRLLTLDEVGGLFG